MDHEATIAGVTHILDQVQALLRDLKDQYAEGMAELHNSDDPELRMRMFMILARFAVSMDSLKDAWE